MIFQYILFIFNIFFLIVNCQEYNENLLKTAVNISQSSYCIPNTNSWNCLTCDNNNIYEKSSLIKGEFIVYGYNSFYESIFIGFRGSTNLQNWLTDIHFSMVYPYNNNIGLEKGFYYLFKSLKDDIYENLNSLSSKYGNNNILITGHSLGGAIASLLSFDILYNSEPYNISLITFGSPRVGNQIFSSLFNEYNIYSKRITHYYDIVPHLPQSFLNYKHIANEIWFNLDNSNYQICNDTQDEDYSCSDSCAPKYCTSVNDHMLYMNITMGSEGDC